MKLRKIVSVVLVLVILLLMLPTAEVLAAEPKTLAYWRFENTNGCYSGNINDGTFVIKDLTGKGNDLKVMSQGTTAENLLKWKSDGYGNVSSSLLFDNQKKYCDLSKQDTFYGGVVPVAKWFETVGNAPINKEEFKGGYTIEAIIKFTPEFDFGYNRYSGIFSRQGTRMSCNISSEDTTDNQDPLTALNVATNTGANADSGTISNSNKANLQFINTGVDSQNNDALDKWETNFDLVPGQWYHIAVVNDGKKNTMYINGKVFYESNMEITEMTFGKDGFAWDIGMGRKFNSKPGSDAAKDDKGTPRRPFMGQMAAIRVSSGAVAKANFLSEANYNLPANQDPTQVAPTNTIEPTVEPTEILTTPEPEETTAPESTTGEPENTSANTSETSTSTPTNTTPAVNNVEDNKNGNIILFSILVAIVGGGVGAAYFIIKKKKSS